MAPFGDIAVRMLAAAPSTTSLMPGAGISYSPYAVGRCKTQEEVSSDLRLLDRQYNFVRIYGTDCDQTAKVLSAVRNQTGPDGRPVQIFAAVDNRIETVDAQIDLIIQAVTTSQQHQHDWSPIYAIAVGNEGASLPEESRSGFSFAELSLAMSSARQKLTQAGYQGPVVTVDNFVAIKAHASQFCPLTDFVAANCHPFFDPSATAASAGAWVQQQIPDLQRACPGKRVLIAESGWPSQGDAHDRARPGRTEQQAAVQNLQDNFPQGGLVLFTLFDDAWKAPGIYNVERHWGITPSQLLSTT